MSQTNRFHQELDNTNEQQIEELTQLTETELRRSTHPDWQDAVHDAYLAARQRIDVCKKDPINNLSTYFRTAIWRKLAERHRRRSLRRTISLDFDRSNQFVEEMTEVDRAAFRRDFTNAGHQLTRLEKECFTRRHVDDSSPAEVAQQLRISIDAVYHYTSLAKTKLQRILARWNPYLHDHTYHEEPDNERSHSPITSTTGGTE